MVRSGLSLRTQIVVVFVFFLFVDNFCLKCSVLSLYAQSNYLTFIMLTSISMLLSSVSSQISGFSLEM